jgi:hypothetical protein
MNSFSQLQKGLNETNAYSMVKNNTLFNEDEDGRQPSEDEIQMKKRIAMFSFMSEKSSRWMFELNHFNPFQKKKVKDLPDAYKKTIFQMNKTLKENKQKLSDIKASNKKLKQTLDVQLKETMDRNILSLKVINNQICKVTMNLKSYTEEVKYFGEIVDQIEKYRDSFKQGSIPNYMVPSENVQVVLNRLTEKFDCIQKNIEMLKELVTAENQSSIPNNQIQ